MPREKMQDVHIKIEPHVYERFAIMAQHTPHTQAELIRMALDEYIKKVDRMK